MPKFVKPSAPGAVIPHAERGLIPLAQEGEWVPDTTYWTRRINAGDVVEADPPPAPAAEVLPADEDVKPRRRSPAPEEK